MCVVLSSNICMYVCMYVCVCIYTHEQFTYFYACLYVSEVIIMHV